MLRPVKFIFDKKHSIIQDFRNEKDIPKIAAEHIEMDSYGSYTYSIDLKDFSIEEIKTAIEMISEDGSIHSKLYGLSNYIDIIEETIKDKKILKDLYINFLERLNK